MQAFRNHEARIAGGHDNVTPMTHGNLPNSVVTPVHGVQSTTAGHAAPVKQVMTGAGAAQHVGGVAGTQHAGGAPHVGSSNAPGTTHVPTAGAVIHKA